MSHIMSYLSIKDAVRTSILSKDWEYKWRSLYTVEFNDCSIKFLWQEEVFAKFVDRVLPLLHHVKSFRLAIRYHYGLNRAQRWISTALRYDLEVLQVLSRGIVFPCSLISSNFLRKLDLQNAECTMNVGAKNCARNLTSVYLGGVDIVNGDSNTSTVTFSFPLLVTFTAIRCKWLNVKNVEIYAPSLTTFASAPENADKDYDYSFVIHAPRLSEFKCSNGLPEKYTLDGSSIVSASLCSDCELENVQLLEDGGSRVGKMLNDFTSLEKLELSGVMAKVCQLGLPLQRRDKLRQLTLSTRPCYPQHLLGILDAAPSLTFLRIEVFEFVDCDYGAVESVPSCIVSHLEEIEFIGFEWEAPQYNLAEFLLQNGRRLKKFCVVDLSRKMQNEVEKYLSAIRNINIVFKNRW